VTVLADSGRLTIEAPTRGHLGGPAALTAGGSGSSVLARRSIVAPSAWFLTLRMRWPGAVSFASLRSRMLRVFRVRSLVVLALLVGVAVATATVGASASGSHRSSPGRVVPAWLRERDHELRVRGQRLVHQRRVQLMARERRLVRRLRSPAARAMRRRSRTRFHVSGPPWFGPFGVLVVCALGVRVEGVGSDGESEAVFA
jgi:hypothetical protein